MAKITFIESDGQAQTFDIDEGTTLMEGAVGNGVEGIVAECGGACACATCHCYIDAGWLAKVGPADEMEEAMLVLVEKKPGSRLACQITVTHDLNGLVVSLPDKQV